MCKKLLVICLGLLMASASYADYTPQVIGNWEGTMDGWNVLAGSSVYSSDSRVVTLDDQALGMWEGQDWIQMLNRGWSHYDAHTQLGLMYGGTITIDVTVLAEEWDLGSALDTEGQETHWGIKPLENIVLQTDVVGWWGQLSPDVQPDFSGLGDRDGVWKPEDGDQQFTYTFTVPAHTNFHSDLNMILITNRGPVDLAGAVYLDNMVWTPVPEPATIAMLGLGGLALIRRKK